MCNDSKTWIVLQLWCCGNKSAHNTSSCTSSWKTYHTKTSIFALLSTSVDSSTCIAYYGDSFILSNNCASISSAISSIRLVMVLAERGACATFGMGAPKNSWQISLAAGRINSSLIVKGFLALARWLATKNYAVSADTFDEVLAFNNCFSFLCCFFLLKNSKGLWFNAGC